MSKIATKQKRRNWNSKSLQFEDYAFAVSTNRGRWESPSHTWHRRLVLDCLAWEIEREFVRCKKQPFVIARKNWIEEIQQYHKPKPRDRQPLNEVLELEQAIEVIKQQPQFPLSTFHVFEIEHQEGVEITVQRFRNWLVKKSTVRGKQKGRRFICANGAGAFSWQASSGRRDVPRALLRAACGRGRGHGLDADMARLRTGHGPGSGTDCPWLRTSARPFGRTDCGFTATVSRTQKPRFDEE